jgi:hypothetical protein
MLTISEVLQACRDAAADAEVTNRTVRAFESLPEEAGRGVREREFDVPRVRVAFPGDVDLFVHLDDLDPTRWVATIRDSGRDVSRVLVDGVGQVREQVAVARQLAGLPEPPRPVQPSRIGQGPLDIVTTEQGGNR